MIKPRESRVEDEMTNINGDVLNTDDYSGTNSYCSKKCVNSDIMSAVPITQRLMRWYFKVFAKTK